MVLWYAGRTILEQWRQLPPNSFTLRPRWELVALSGIIVLVSYAVLINTWRLVLGAWSDRRSLPWITAARIWFVSNLGRFVPGKIWQILALAEMARRRRISPVAATGAAVLVNLVNVLTGFAITLVFGARVLQRPGVALAALVAGTVMVASAPWLLPRLMRAASAMTGKALPDATVPSRAIWISAAGTTAAWLLYGIAFQVLAAGTLGSAAGAWTEYVAVFAGSYLVGYLVLFIPGGIGVREVAMTAALTNLGLTTAPQGLVLAFVSRLWLTILEVGPGAIFLLRPERGDGLTDHSTDVTSG